MRKRKDEEKMYNGGGLGYSQDALDALKAGNYREFSGNRQAQYRTSQEQKQQAKNLPVLEGLTRSPEFNNSNNSRIDTDRARRKYENRIDYKPIGRALSEKDRDILWGAAFRMNSNGMTAREAADDILNGRAEGNAGIVKAYARQKDWQKEYGKSLEQLIDEYSKNDAAIQRHKEEIGRSGGNVSRTAYSLLSNAFIKPAMGANTMTRNLIDPESKGAKGANYMARTFSDIANIARDETTKNSSTLGKLGYETLANVGDRALLYLLPGGKAIAPIATLFRTAEDKRESLEDRGITGRGAIGQSLASGGVDAALDIVGLEKIKGLKALKESGNLAKAAIGSAAIGGGEQAITSLIDKAVDLVFNGEDSVYSVSKQNYMNQGLSEGEAQTRAIIDEAASLAQETGQGALFGILMGAGEKTFNKLLGKITGSNVKSQPETPENLQRALEKVDEVPTEKLQTALEKPISPDELVNPTAGEVRDSGFRPTENSAPRNPKDIAKEYRDVIASYDTDKGYYDDADLDNIARELEEDIANGEDLSKHVEAIQDFMEDVDDFELLSRMTNLMGEIDAAQKTNTNANVNRVMNESRPANPSITEEITRDNGNNVPHVDGTMPTDRQRKTSQYYQNTMRNTPTNADMSDAEYGKRFNEDEYGYLASSHAGVDAESNRFIQDAGGDDAAIDKILNEDFESDEKFNSIHIDAAEKLADKVERQAKELEAQGQDATEQWMLANRLHKKVRENATLYAQGMEILKKWKKSTPQGQVDYIITEINKSVDSKKTKGYTQMVNKVADKVEDAILKGNDKNTTTENVKKIFEENRGKSDYNTDKYEQLVLDLIGGEDFGMRSPASIAEEAGALIKRNMGVSTLTAKQERAMLDLFETASRYPENSRSYNECISRAMDILDSTLPTSIGDKVRSVMYDNMLASLRTMLTRNMGGNVLAGAIETTSRPLQVLADVIASKKTGYRTRTLTGKSIIEGAKGFKKGVKDWYLDVKQGVDTTRSGQESLENALRAVHKTFKTQSDNKAVQGINKVLGGYDRVVRKGMELGDRPIYEGRYAATKAELYDLVDRFGDEGLRKGIPNKDITTDELIELIAVNEGLEAVLQNDSTMKKGAQALKDAIRKTSEDIVGVDIATMSTTPFVEVPANMASRFFQYTPFGIAGNIARSIGEKSKYGAVNQRRMTGEAGRNALGSLMAAGAMGLAANNNISDPYSEDPDEKKLQQNNDYIEYALQSGDGERQIDLSDVPILGPMLRYGKMQYDAYKEGGIPSLLGNIPNAAGSASIDTLYQGLNKLTGATEKYSSGDSILENAKNALVSSVGSMTTPALIRQTAQFLDPYKRDLGDYGSSEYNKNLFINGLPILREKMLDPKIGTSGEPVKQNGGEMGVGKFFNTYIAPWKISTPKENMSEAQRYAEELKLQTNGLVNPQSQVFNAGDLKKTKGYDAENYSHKDLYKLDKQLYTSNDKLATALISDEWFRSLPPEKQGKYIDTLYSNNKAVIKENFVREGMTAGEIEKAGDSLYTASDRLAKILKDDDENHSGMMEYFHNIDGIDNLQQKYGYKMDYDTYVKWNTEPEKKALGGAEKYAEVHDRARDLNMTVENYLKAEQKYAGGAEEKVRTDNALKDAGIVKADGTPNVEHYNKVLSAAKGQSARMKNDFPALKELGLGDAADYVYANAINVNPNISLNEFAQTYNEIDTNKGDKLTQKEALEYINKYQFSENPDEDLQMVTELWNTYQDGTWKKVPYVKKDGTYGAH